MGNKKRTYFMLLLGTAVDIEVGLSKDALRPVRVFVPGHFSIRLTGEQARDLAEKLASVYNALEFHYSTIPISPFKDRAGAKRKEVTTDAKPRTIIEG